MDGRRGRLPRALAQGEMGGEDVDGPVWRGVWRYNDSSGQPIKSANPLPRLCLIVIDPTVTRSYPTPGLATSAWRQMRWCPSPPSLKSRGSSRYEDRWMGCRLKIASPSSSRAKPPPFLGPPLPPLRKAMAGWKT